MKLKVFNSLNKPSSARKSIPIIRISGKSGVIAVSYKACEVIGILPEDKISLCQDENEPKDWYINKDKDGYIVRALREEKGVIFNNAALARIVLRSLGLDDDNSVSVRMAEQPEILNKEKYYALLTASIIGNE